MPRTWTRPSRHRRAERPDLPRPAWPPRGSTLVTRPFPRQAWCALASLVLGACASGPGGSSSAPVPAASLPANSASPLASASPTVSQVTENLDGTVARPEPTGVEARDLIGNYYGAIALAYRGGAYGYSYDYGSASRALSVAQSKCKQATAFDSTCHKIAWVRNGCLALSVKWVGSNPSRYGWAVRGTKKAAITAANRVCGAGCKLRVWVCTTR